MRSAYACYRGMGGTEPVGIEPLGMEPFGTLPGGTVVPRGLPMVARVSPVSGMVLPGGALPGAVLSIMLRRFIGSDMPLLFWLASVLLSLVRPPVMALPGSPGWVR